MKAWGDGKKFIFEDLVIYGTVILGDLGYDLFANFMHAVNLRGTGTPYHFGYEQTFILFAFGVLLARKVSQWKYYA